MAAGRLRLRPKTKLKMFHATLLVTRAEEWCVEAETAEEARARLLAGEGERCHLGNCLYTEIQQLND